MSENERACIEAVACACASLLGSSSIHSSSSSSVCHAGRPDAAAWFIVASSEDSLRELEEMEVAEDGGRNETERGRVQSEFRSRPTHVIAGVDPTVGPYLFRTNSGSPLLSSSYIFLIIPPWRRTYPHISKKDIIMALRNEQSKAACCAESQAFIMFAAQNLQRQYLTILGNDGAYHILSRWAMGL